MREARDLISKAGCPSELEVACMTVSGRQRELTILAEIMPADLAKINARVKVEDLTPPRAN